MLQRLFAGFLPGGGNPFEAFRAKALVAYLFIVLLVAGLWGVEHALVRAWAPMALYAVVMVALVIVLLRQRRRPDTRGNARLAICVGVVAITVATYLTGGLRMTNIMPFLGLMVAAVFLLGREGVYWTLGVLVLAFGFQVGHWAGVPYPDAVPPEARPADAFITWFSTTLLVMLWLWAYERARTQTTEALAEGQRRVRAIFDGTPDLALLHDEAGRLLETNAALGERLGYSRDELAVMNLRDIWARRPFRFVERLVELREAKQVVFEGAIAPKQGVAIPVEVHARYFELDGQAVVLSVLRDIRERIAAERERAQLSAQLQQAQKMESVGRLAGGVAHDFNNLLTAMSGYCELLRANEPLSEQGQRDLAEVRRAADRAASLTQQLLAFGRRQLITPRVVDLGEVMEQATRMLRRLIGEDISLEVQRHGEPSWVHVDPHQMDQLLINLAVNARDAMPDGGRLQMASSHLPGAEVQGFEASAETYACLEVRDTGSGMDEAIRQRVFEPFFTTKEVGKGSGLGLATVYGIVKQNHGHITVESAVGEGTTFRLLLPLHARPEVSAETPEPMPIPRGNERILLVEDETKVRQLAERVLTACGYRIDACADAEEALEQAVKENGVYDLLLTDVVMPGSSGLELVAELSERWSSLRVLYTSGYPEEIVSARGVQPQGVDLLLKPYTPFVLAQRVRAALDASADEPASAAGAG